MHPVAIQGRRKYPGFPVFCIRDHAVCRTIQQVACRITDLIFIRVNQFHTDADGRFAVISEFFQLFAVIFRHIFIIGSEPVNAEFTVKKIICTVKHTTGASTFDDDLFPFCSDTEFFFTHRSIITQNEFYAISFFCIIAENFLKIRIQFFNGCFFCRCGIGNIQRNGHCVIQFQRRCA